MSGEHPNATAYRRTADAFRVGDQASLAPLIDPDVVWHVPGSHTMAGDVRGDRRSWNGCATWHQIFAG